MGRIKERGKYLISRSFERFGLTLSGYGHANCLRHLLAAERIDVAVDVGANIGQYGSWLRRFVGYRGRILSVEPVSDSHAALSLRAAEDSSWTVLPRCALGSESGEATIQVSQNSVSSSILPPSELGLEKMANAVRAIREEVVPVRTLSQLRVDHLAPGQRAFLKVDTQGFERQVIAGIGCDLSLWPVIQLELSTAPLYSGETSFSTMHAHLESLGYELYSVFPSYWTKPAYRMLQADCLFVRTSEVSVSVRARQSSTSTES